MITLTEKAAGEVLRIIDEKKLPDETGLVVSLKGGGCSGMTYVLDFGQDAGDGKHKIVESRGVRLLIDGSALPFVEGLEIDYMDDLLNRGFKFSNPNASHTCGCGTSFSV